MKILQRYFEFVTESVKVRYYYAVDDAIVLTLTVSGVSDVSPIIKFPHNCWQFHIFSFVLIALIVLKHPLLLFFVIGNFLVRAGSRLFSS